MLDAMRANSRSFLITLLFGVIIASFIISFGRGSSGFRTRTPETWAAKVNGEIVPAAQLDQTYGRRFQEMRQQRGDKYSVENARQDNLKSEALKALIDQELLAQEAQSLGIVVGDDEVARTIVALPQFQQNGKFDDQVYKNYVENYVGVSIPKFEESVRRDLLRSKAIEAVVNGATTSDDEVKASFVAENESAKIQYVKFTSFMFRGEAKATDAEADE